MLVIDGIEIKTRPITMVRLDCGHTILAHPGHTIAVGDPAECPEECEHSTRLDVHALDVFRLTCTV